ncbi:MAG: Cof-type HAD-IIB family hydrolase [Bacilli bacterium]|nr:Cof-type HAD-IIB family hydrolase [Bacilli bacterium]
MKVLASDLDGTLFYPKSRFLMVPKANRKFLHRVYERGDRLLVVSSRSLQFKPQLQKRLGVDFDFIGCDGCVIESGGKIVHEEFFEPASTLAMIDEIAKDYEPGMMILTSPEHPMVCTRKEVGFRTTVGYFLYMSVQGVYREEYVRDDKLFREVIEQGKCYKIMVLIGITAKSKQRAEVITKELIEKYPGFHFAWLNEFIEITPKGCTKATGVAKYLDSLGLSEDNVYVVGDSGNDVPMFEAFYENSYCMGHAPQSIREKAKHVVENYTDLEAALYPLEDNQTPKS